MNESNTNDFTMGTAGPNLPRPTPTNIPNAPTPPPPNPSGNGYGSGNLQTIPVQVAPTRAAAQPATVELTRTEEIQALPTMGQISGLVPVTNGATIFLMPLRGQAANDAYFNEATLRRHIPTKVRAMSAAIDGIIQQQNPQMNIATISVDGFIDLTTCKWETTRNGKNGVYRMRVQECWVDALMRVLHDHMVVTRLDPTNAAMSAYNFEATVDSELYPGAVIEQIRIQAGVNAMPKNAYNNGKQDVTYLMAIPEGATLTAIRERGYLAILGDRGQIHLSVVDRRITSETVYMWGFSGPGSAKVEGIPALAGAIGTPIDAVSHSTTPDLKPAAGHMAAMRYPYSIENYDAIARLLEVGVFKLQNPRTGTWIEITVGHTATEVEKRIGRRVLKKIADESVEGEDDDEVPVIELSLSRAQIAEGVAFDPTIHSGASHSEHITSAVLIPSETWEARKSISFEAARAARERASGRDAVDGVCIPHGYKWSAWRRVEIPWRLVHIPFLSIFLFLLLSFSWTSSPPPQATHHSDEEPTGDIWRSAEATSPRPLRERWKADEWGGEERWDGVWMALI